MKISRKKPPHFWLMKLLYKCDWGNTAFGFGDKIYAKYTLPVDLITHENTHCEQQRFSYLLAWVWLARYIVSRSFRYRMELEAYQNQFAHYSAINPHQKYLFLDRIAKDLSGEMYGNLVTYAEAREKIQHGRKTKK